MAATVAIRCLSASGSIDSCSLDQLASRAGDSLVWVDVRDPDESTMGALAERFALHPLAVEDALHSQYRPKIDLYEDKTAFIVWMVPRTRDGRPIQADSILDTDEIDFFFGPGFLVSAHRGAVPALDEAFSHAADTMPSGPAWVIHAVLDRSVDAVFPVLDDISDRLDATEDKMLSAAPLKADLAELYAIKRLLLGMRRILAPERDIVRTLAREESLVSSHAFLYFQDVGDHLARAEDAVETYRDIAASAADIYLSSVSNRLNEVMKRLTLVATIFMPLTFIVGVYGMNFRYMPELGWRFGYPLILGGMGVIVVGMIVWFRKQEWL